MRFVLCDDDELIRHMVEDIVLRHGHEIVGVADTGVAAAGLVEHARPDVVIVDVSLDYGSDFDIVGIAAGVGARVIVFGLQADGETLERHPIRPTFVLKPDLNTLERAIDEVAKDVDPDSAPAERRHAPAREVSAPVPTGAADAQAFYEALNEAAEGDTLLSITAAEGPAALAADVAATLRGSDRLLASSTAMQVLLLGGGDVGARSFVDRLVQTRGREGLAVRSIVLGPNETPADGFDRLKRSEPHPA